MSPADKAEMHAGVARSLALMRQQSPDEDLKRGVVTHTHFLSLGDSNTPSDKRFAVQQLKPGLFAMHQTCCKCGKKFPTSLRKMARMHGALRDQPRCPTCRAAYAKEQKKLATDPNYLPF